MLRQLSSPGRVVFWELVQNTPIIFGVGMALRNLEGGLLRAFVIMATGTILSAFVIELTQKYKRYYKNRNFRIKDFIYNSIIFTLFALLYLIYYSFGSFLIDLCFGFVLGLSGGIMQWITLKLGKIGGVRHTTAISCAGCITLVGFRLSVHSNILHAIVILFCTALIMTSIIAIIDYGSR